MSGEQAALWNGPGGNAWVDLQEVLDAAFARIAELLAQRVAGEGATRVLDVGCGTGATTLAVADRLGGDPLGVDVSEPMIALARSRAAAAGLPARFVAADAGTHPFEPAAFDAVISRFGVMFFEDPVAAFANLRRATSDGGRLSAIVWRGPADNPFMTEARRAAEPLLPGLPDPAPGAPGQFAFADPERVRGILTDAGWRDAALEPADIACAFPEAGLVPYITRLGPVARALEELDPPLRERVVTTMRAAFEPYVAGDEVRFTAACWLVSARA